MRKHSTRMWMGVFMLALPLAARAEGKCGDDPEEYPPGGPLVVTWAIPYPRDASVEMVDASVFNEVDGQLGKYPPGYDGPTDPTLVGFFNDKEFRLVAPLATWTKLISKKEMPLEAQKHLRAIVPDPRPGQDQTTTSGKYFMRGALVEHPRVAQPKGFNICTCVLQRGVLIYREDGTEDLYVRTLFQTRKGAETRKFLPTGGWYFHFTSGTIWFPVLLNRLLTGTERAWMLLDVLSPKPFKQDATLWHPYTAAFPPQQIKVDGTPYFAVRLYRKFEVNNSADDLAIDPKAVWK